MRWLLVLMFGVVACAPPARPAPSPTTAPAPLEGAVLGATKASWVAAKGEPSKGPVQLYDRFGRDLDVLWRAYGDGEERAHQVELVLPQEQPVARARELAKSLLPRDAAVVRTYTAPAGQTVEVFKSAALAEALGADPFGGDEPGTFIQIAERRTPRTTRVVIAVGNRP